MEQSWEILGLYATWRMTITVDPPDDGKQTDLRYWGKEDLNSLVGHFKEAATLWEMYEEHERANARRSR